MRHRARIACLLMGVGLLAGALSGMAQTAPPEPPKAEAPAPPTEDPSAAIRQRIEAYLRYVFAWGSEMQVRIGPPRESVIPGLYSVLVQTSGAQRQIEEVVLVSADGRYIVRGDLLDTARDPFAEARDNIATGGHPSRGPANAPVTIVEYGDFQCTTCAQMHPILKRLLAENKNVRLVFKDFPLTRMHNWALPAAVAAQCAFRQSNEGFWRLHDFFYENQKQLTAENLALRLDAFAPRAGLNLQQFRLCRAQELTRARVEQSMQEGTTFEVVNTPTLFINGRPAVGAQPLEALQQVINFEIQLQQRGSALPPR